MELFWIAGASPGRVGTATRPRGGEWLVGDMNELVANRVDCLVSMLTASENVELGLTGESKAAGAVGIDFASIPIEDRGLPERTMPFVDAVTDSARAIRSGKSVAVHCRMGVGRSSMFAASCLISLGADPREVWGDITRVRGRPVPDVVTQREWIESIVPLLRRG